MPETDSTFFVQSAVILLAVSAVVAIFVRWIKLPYSLALVLAGLMIGMLKLLPGVQLTPNLILFIFLPALLFEASWNIDIKELKRDRLAISVLSTAGVIVSMLVIAGTLHCLFAVDLKASLLFGAMMSATDPISVIALFRKAGIDRRLTLLLEGESLFNDGTSMVLFKLLLAFAVYDSSLSLAEGGIQFLLVCTGGCALGITTGLLASRITKFFDDRLPEIMLSTVAAYGSYLLADGFHVSPVLAVIMTGIVLGNYGSRESMSATTRAAVSAFWEYAAFVVNSLVFLLIGMQIHPETLDKYAALIIAGIAAVLLSRMIMIYLFCPLLSSKRLPIPAKWMHLLFWGGLRGALSMAMALSIPLQYPMREALMVMSFGVVLFTLLVQGLSMEPLVKLMGMTETEQATSAFNRLNSLLLLQREALSEIQRMKEDGNLSEENFTELAGEIRAKAENIMNRINDLQLEKTALDKLQLHDAKLKILEKQKDKLLSMEKIGALDLDNFEAIRLELDERAETIIAESNSPEPDSASGESS